MVVPHANAQAQQRRIGTDNLPILNQVASACLGPDSTATPQP